jgi:hypothetical protein
MGLFIDEATAAAGRQVGRRYWRWFLGVRMLRGLAPVIGALLAVAGLVLAASWLAGHSAGGWAATTGWAARWAPASGAWAAWLLGGAIVLAVLATAVVAVRRNWWRMSTWSPVSLVPYRFRRY